MLVLGLPYDLVNCVDLEFGWLVGGCECSYGAFALPFTQLMTLAVERSCHFDLCNIPYSKRSYLD
jgi:hypothetical protein